ncbi:N-acetyltransferase B complex non catalytic subunit-domain-containing protein [Rostrohypoxylon terebratum]|nr:N-acetyltransferase B complex non catalytic subunit-domain-containing protein [Rostrohypoxylon terebratum]
MRPPLPKPSPRPINVKQSAPINLQSSFAEEQWTITANLARQRYRATKDEYYLAVEVAAKSQSDNVADRGAGKAAVEKMVKDNITVTDVDGLDMYEFACSHTDIKYPETIGMLRLRLVKAAPKDQKACVRCFNSCVWNYDWKNAQQIAASLSKNFTDRKFSFQYIMATHLYSLSSDCPEGSRKIFASLAKALADKAFDSQTKTIGPMKRIDRAALSESEDLMWLDIRITHCSPEENLALFKKAGHTPLNFLQIGRHDPFWRMIQYLKEHGAWDEVWQLGLLLLEDAISTLQAEAECIEQNEKVAGLKKLAHDNANQDSPADIRSVEADLRLVANLARPARNVKTHCYVVESCEYKCLQSWLEAAKHQEDPKKALKQLGNLIERLSKSLKRAYAMKPIYARSLELISLTIDVTRASFTDLGLQSFTTSRVANLSKHVVQNYNNPTSLDEAIVLIKNLTVSEVTRFVTTFQTAANKCENVLMRYTMTSINLKIWYSVIMDTGPICRFCGSEPTGDVCISCIKEVASSALKTYSSSFEYDDLQDQITKQGKNPLSDIAVIGSMCLLRIARLGSLSTPHGTSSLFHANIQLFMQAVLWLDSCRQASSFVSTDHNMILIKLYILMGAVSLATPIWHGFGVKNALLDSLGLLFIDRLSSIAPGLFMGPSPSNPVTRYMIHFTKALKTTIPKRIMDALDQETYSSIPGIIEYAEKRITSCSVALTVVEERRGARIRANKVEISMEDQSLIRDLSIEHELTDVTDYKVFNVPNGRDSSSSPNGRTSHQSIIHYGPLPTSMRAHLGLLAERFLDLVCYVQPKEYKPPKAGRIIQLDLEYAFATSSRIERDINFLIPVVDLSLSEEEQAKVLRQQELARTSLTSSELSYYNVVSGLATVVNDIIESGIITAATNDTRDRIRSSIKRVLTVLELQTSDFLMMPENLHSKLYGFHGFAALHAMGMLRETIIAFKHTANYLTIVLEKAKNVDKLRSQAELAWLAPELKKMAAAVTSSEKSVRDRIKLLQRYLDNVDGWRERLCDWVFGEYATLHDQDKIFKDETSTKMKSMIPKDYAESWADGIRDSWQDLIGGWTAVKFE